MIHKLHVDGNKAFCYINSHEIPGELSREIMISSDVIK